LDRWGGESSSEQTRTDLSPTPADELAHPESAAPGTREWNPMRAMKDVEVGTFYYNAGNYKAAISRFREALEFKPRDAVATFKLAQALEKSGEPDEARAQYEAYLAILKDGPSAGDARKALERLKKP
jgi:tetratricopeptide (TPR) repeat protein